MGVPGLDSVDKQIEHVMHEKELPEDEVVELCERLQEILQEEANCVNVRSPVCVVGDLHGQFQDFKELLLNCGPPPETNYLFLGDYVDRGESSVRTASLAFLYKIRFASRVTLLRGNHESRQITQVYGFYDECMRTYGSAHVWSTFNSTFDFLPLAAVVEHRVFCCHGGLSPCISTRDEIEHVDRFQEPSHEGAICDLLWSDPDDDIQGWAMSRRGAGASWGQDVSEMFNHANGFDKIVRAHQCVMDGFSWTHARNVLTVFSAPNYAYRVGNKGAALDISENLDYAIKQFEQAPNQRDPLKRIGYQLPDNFHTATAAGCVTIRSRV